MARRDTPMAVETHRSGPWAHFVTGSGARFAVHDRTGEIRDEDHLATGYFADLWAKRPRRLRRALWIEALAGAALLAVLVAWAGVAGAQVIECMSAGELVLFLHTTGLPFEQVPGGFIIHADAGAVFYALTDDGLYCVTESVPL